jgi:nucleoid DNA-binding protein
MSHGSKEIPKKLLKVLELAAFRKLNDLKDPTHFGDELEIYGSPSMQFRIVKDRGQWSIEVGPADLSGEWYDLQDVLSAAGANEEISSFDLDSLAETFCENFPKIQEFFADYASNREAIKLAAETRAGELMSEIFPRFQNGKRTAEGESKHRRPLNKVQLVKAVQKQLGSQTTKAEAERAVTAVINAVKVGVKRDKIVQLVGFGTFKVVERKARKGINPRTLEQIRILKSKTVKFVPSKDFKSK